MSNEERDRETARRIIEPWIASKHGPELLIEHFRGAAGASLLKRLETFEKLLGSITPCPNCDGSGRNKQGDCCRIAGHSRECACTLCQWKNASQKQQAVEIGLRKRLEDAERKAEYIDKQLWQFISIDEWMRKEPK